MVVVEKLIPSPVDEVFAALSDPRSYPDWLVGAKGIRDVDPGFPQKGTSFHHTVGVGPFTLPDRSTVISVDPVREIEMIVRSRPLLVARVHFALSSSRDWTRLRMTEQPIGVYRGSAPVVEPLLRRRNQRSLDQLAGYLARRRGEAA